MGGAGAGKSTGWLNIALLSAQTGSDARFYVLDSDDAVAVMLARDAQWANLTNIEVFGAREWENYTKATDQILGRIRPNDWFIGDFVSTAWDAVQEWYVERIYGKTDMGQYFMDAREANKKAALDGWKDYSVINRVYRTWSNKIQFDMPSHVYLTAEAETVRDTDERELKKLFYQFGVRPKGQKHLTYTVHTVLLFQTDGRGGYFMNTAKDRGRERMTHS